MLDLNDEGELKVNQVKFELREAIVIVLNRHVLKV